MTFSGRDVVLLLLGVEGEREGIGGITRLQKFLFLLSQEGGLKELETGFEFAPYKAGPYSARLYDDLEFLENLDLISTKIAGDAVDAEAAEIDLLTYEELMGDNAETTSAAGGPSDGLGASDAYEERYYRLTDKGRAQVTKLLADNRYEALIKKIQDVKRKYSKYSLNELLYHIYTKYPDWATESEIKDQVLRSRR